MEHFDYIFAGGGLAAHMTLLRMTEHSAFKGKSILIIDPKSKTDNDRTWCFWEPDGGEFDSILRCSWQEADFRDDQGNIPMSIYPYRYKMVRSGAFYAFVRDRIKSLQVTWLEAAVTNINESSSQVNVSTSAGEFSCDTLLNSLYDPDRAAGHRNFPLLQQHFIGWFVTTDKPVFNARKPLFMDFSVAQHGNTRFMYVLPLSETEALVEYTLFSHDLLPDAEYEQAIDDYLKALGTTYQIDETERGSIPMTCYPFAQHNTRRTVHIGSAGGWTKASTGFTFYNTVKHSRKLVTLLAAHKPTLAFPRRNRFWFYDLLLLDILDRNNEKGASIFSSMFRNASPALIFKFLDEDTSVAEDLKVIWSCPKLLFIKALLRRLVRF